MTRAVCPGSFDPVTNGHLDIITRAAEIFDEVIVAVGNNPNKKTLFTIEERVALLKQVIADTGLKNVRVDHFSGLQVDYARAQKAQVIVKGLRALSDFEYEFQMALTNKKLAPELETMFMMTENKYAFLSSSLVKEIVFFGGNPEGLIPPVVLAPLQEKMAKVREKI
ncbi:MAG TPA: pantetheine-phosphate adenylyltransferase [Firmicutes bacterium]|uniref:Phosphopantetheine adenylyltransferase n=1 Tax=Capillibacterium thermochitinicola TaxID=2699427 RepID=A0A8J6I3D2_9FIRM|nr:pantetheine-phosphate adenylyltransferase [Capillibacterium thermochitinicola]MBA2133507.1 pantetheine-phosphate adenylyltransferase [Capillibacterium thermochitinicola]HHW13114.1 pantetheine-phosphate adenylyltransferase [Bacillota bacterium]